MAYDTNNPVGSKDPRDLYDNATNFDNYSVGPDPFYPNRFGVQKLSIEGQQQAFESAQTGRQTAFEQFLADSAFIYIGDYGAGLNFTSRTQYMIRDGVAYRVSPGTTVPYTTTGNWAIEVTNFTPMPLDDVLRQDLADPAEGANLVAFDASSTHAAGTVGDRLSKYITVTDAPFNAVADSKVTDNTAAVLAAGIAAGPRGAIYIPPLVGFDLNALQEDPTWPPEVVIYDNSLINGGYLKDKTTGIFSKELADATSDTTFVVSSGHNAGLALDNNGKSGSASGLARVAVLAWTVGKMISGLLRSAARLEFAKSSVDADRWAMVLRKRAPMKAILKDYNRWATGMTVAVGDFVLNASHFYEATTAGTAGATAPTHTAGTVSDGGVDWAYYPYSYDSGALYVDDLGRIATNTAPQANQFQRWRQAVEDTNNMTIQYEPLGVSKNVTFRARPTNASAVAVTAIPDLRFTELGVEFLSSLGSSVGRFSNEGFTQAARIEPAPTAADGDTTPTGLNRAAITLSNTTATSITAIDGMVDNQVITLWATNNNSTLVAGAGFNMIGTGNLLLTQGSCITFKKVTFSTALHEQSRCIQ